MSQSYILNEDSSELERKSSINENNSSLNVSYEDISNSNQQDIPINKMFNDKDDDIPISNNKNNNLKEDMVMANSFNSLNDDLSFEGYMNTNFEANMEEVMENLNYYWFTEKKKLRLEKENLDRSIRSFIELNSSEFQKFDKEKEKWKTNSKIASDVLLQKPEDIIDIEIDGKVNISTTRQTLTKYPNSILAKIFQPQSLPYKFNLEKKTKIIREPKSFLNLLYYLRTSKVPNFNYIEDKINFFNELDYWQIPLTDLNQSSNFIFDSDWCANTLLIESNNKIIKNSKTHGIVFCKPPMDKKNNIIHFKVITMIPCKGKSHLFLGLVDRSKYKYENLLSTFWKDSPSSFYWDTWNTKLIKINDKGLQVGSVNGYGCQCESIETIFTIKYDYDNKSVTYFKNGINLGVAFTNVPSGLTPSLDIWFEEGSVEIMSSMEVQSNNYL